MADDIVDKLTASRAEKMTQAVNVCELKVDENY